MPLSCPVTCPCRRSGEGAALLAGAVYAALAAPVFLGGNLAALIGAALAPPHVVTLPLLLWTLAVAGGLVLIGVGVRALLTHGDGPPALSSFVVAVVAAFALVFGWYPKTMGAGWLHGARCFYLAMIAGGTVNLLFASCSHVWQRGFVAAEQTGRLNFSVAEQVRRQLDVIARLTAERDNFAREVERLSAMPRGDDLAALVEILGGRRRVLASLHPDPVKGETEKLAATKKFQTASTLLERAGVR